MNPDGIMPLAVDVVEDAQGLERLRDEWRALERAAPTVSVFSTHLYTTLAWRHFSGAADRLWIVTVRVDGRLVGVVPLRLAQRRQGGLPVRVLKFVAQWEGDRPGIVAAADADRIWQAAWTGLVARRADWDLLELAELDADAWPVRHARAFGPTFHATCTPDTCAAYAAIAGTWDEYLARRPAGARQNFRRHQRHLERDIPHTRFDVAVLPSAVETAYARFLAVEQSGWKREAHVGAGKDERHQHFYRDLLAGFSAEGGAAIWLLTDGKHDLAARLRLVWRGVAYERQIAYDPRFARYAPGTLLRAASLRSLFGSEVREADFMGMPGACRERPHIADWATGERATWRLTVFNLRSRATPLAWLTRLRAALAPRTEAAS